MPIVYPCPNGHDSTEPDYCSECGKRLTGIATAPADSSAPTTPPATPSGSAVCPDCGTPRANATAVFCEVCRYNFATAMPWSPTPSAAPAVPTAPPATAAAPPVTVAAPAVAMPPVAAPPDDSMPLRWEVVVVVDPTLYADPDPATPCPVGEPERRFPLDFAENLIGRRSERRGIFPEIDLSSDHGVSSRHAIVYRESGGNLTLSDVGSTNGTQVNGKDIAPGVRTPLAEGDQITIGCWTRLTVHALPMGTGPRP